MKTPEMYQKVLHHLDRTRSARFHRNRHLDMAINIAIEDIINDRIEPLKRVRGYNFESVMRVKNELSAIVKSKVPVVVSGNYFLKPADWKYTLGVHPVINGKERNCDSMDMNEFVQHQRNSLMHGSLLFPKFIETDKIEIIFGGGGAILDSGYLTYISNPIKVSSGLELDNTAILTIGSEYMVLSGSVVHDGNTYTVDQYFTATTTSFTGSGTIAIFQNTNLADHLENEICRRAAVILSGNVNNQEKAINKTIESEQQ